MLNNFPNFNEIPQSKIPELQEQISQIEDEQTQIKKLLEQTPPSQSVARARQAPAVVTSQQVDLSASPQAQADQQNPNPVVPPPVVTDISETSLNRGLDQRSRLDMLKKPKAWAVAGLATLALGGGVVADKVLDLGIVNRIGDNVAEVLPMDSQLEYVHNQSEKLEKSLIKTGLKNSKVTLSGEPSKELRLNIWVPDLDNKISGITASDITNIVTMAEFNKKIGNPHLQNIIKIAVDKFGTKGAVGRYGGVLTIKLGKVYDDDDRKKMQGFFQAINPKSEKPVLPSPSSNKKESSKVEYTKLEAKIKSQLSSTFKDIKNIHLLEDYKYDDKGIAKTSLAVKITVPNNISATDVRKFASEAKLPYNGVIEQVTNGTFKTVNSQDDLTKALLDTLPTANPTKEFVILLDKDKLIKPLATPSLPPIPQAPATPNPTKPTNIIPSPKLPEVSFEGRTINDIKKLFTDKKVNSQITPDSIEPNYRYTDNAGKQQTAPYALIVNTPGDKDTGRSKIKPEVVGGEVQKSGLPMTGIMEVPILMKIDQKGEILKQYVIVLNRTKTTK